MLGELKPVRQCPFNCSCYSSKDIVVQNYLPHNFIFAFNYLQVVCNVQPHWNELHLFLVPLDTIWLIRFSFVHVAQRLLRAQAKGLLRVKKLQISVATSIERRRKEIGKVLPKRGSEAVIRKVKSKTDWAWTQITGTKAPTFPKCSTFLFPRESGQQFHRDAVFRKRINWKPTGCINFIAGQFADFLRDHSKRKPQCPENS